MLYATLIAVMLVLVYWKLNGIKFYEKAKIQFFKQLQASVILEVFKLPNSVDKLKNTCPNKLEKIKNSPSYNTNKELRKLSIDA